ncbi:MAG: DUF6624 domain-containing protein [Bacteroidota bacterium]
MLRIALLFLFCFLIGYLCAQESRPPFTESGFEEQALRYTPPQRVGVSDKDYAFGEMVLRETVRQTEDNPAEFNVADYFNVLSAFLSLQEPSPALEMAFEKFITAPGSCEYLLEFWNTVKGNPKYQPIFEAWKQAKLACEQGGLEEEVSATPEAYAKDYHLDAELVRFIHEIGERDQQYRKGTYQPERQTPLDRENEKAIDSLFAKYGQYIGRDLVGDKYESIMWSVIQHSRLATMERYLPIVHQAVQAEQLAVAPLRMLIDRVYTQKTGMQVYGSQQGVALMPTAAREEVMRKFEF